MLLRKAQNYQKNRDYANALINIVRAEKAEGDEALNDEIRQFKNNLIKNLNSRAINEVLAVETGKGLDVSLEYMVFYMKGEVIYPAFNVVVSFEVRKGESRLIAFTYIESAFSSKVYEGFYFARAKIILDIVDASTNRVVFNAVIEDVKGAGSTEEKAGTKAINEATGEFIERLKNEISSLEIE